VGSLEHVLVTSVPEALAVLDRARVRRATSATKCNQHSSRSHLVVRLVLTLGAGAVSVVNLVDLAGNERPEASGATAAQLTVCEPRSCLWTLRPCRR
jgi:hypothetical protein